MLHKRLAAFKNKELQVNNVLLTGERRTEAQKGRVLLCSEDSLILTVMTALLRQREPRQPYSVSS